ncbi:MAG: retroviral-like aspartic protease family protein [Actinomycetia bacterium]|nr:retroviral-like aspartic protease family protein [Actinomycetes bacterium]
MSPNSFNYQAFTITADNLVDRLITPIRVCDAFDPSAPPKKVPEMKTVQGLWDTGATVTCITNELAKELGLKQLGVTEVGNAGGTSQQNTYLVNVVLPNNVLCVGVPVVSAELRSQGLDALIGMDVIGRGDFSLTNCDGKTCLSFRTPSIARVDYVRERNRWIARTVGPNALCPCGSGKKFKKCHYNEWST